MTSAKPNDVDLHFHTCELCEATCGLRIETRRDELLSIRGDTDDPFSRGHICPKAMALADLHADPDRLRGPLRKTASGYQPVPWDEALAEAAERLIAIQGQGGPDAIGVYYGNPIIHNLGAMLYGPMLFETMGTKNRFSASSLDTHAPFLANQLVFGSSFLAPVPDIDRTDLLLLLGSNPLVSNGSMMTAPGVHKRLKALQARGGELVVVDPRATRSAKLADRHLYIRPGTDALLLAALLRLVLDHGARLGRHADYTRGLDPLSRALEPIQLEVCAAATGIEAEHIQELARRLIAAPSAVVHGRMGVSTQEFGGLSCFLIHALNICLGNFDREGGVLFARPALDSVYPVGGLGLDTGYARHHSRVRGWPELNRELPTGALADEILTGGEGQVRGLLTFAGNPVLSSPDGRRLDEALAALEFMVSVDYYVNETTRHADLILPPVSPLQRSHYDGFLYTFAVRNVANYSAPVFPTGPQERHDWQILAELNQRFAAARRGRLSIAAARARLFAALGPEGLLDFALRSGPWGAFRGGLKLSRLRQNPHGLDLGPLTPSVPKRLPPGRRYIDLAPAVILADLERLRERAATPPAPLLLIGRRQLRGDNSWLHNSARLMRGKPRCTLLVHPSDAEAAGVSEGGQAWVESRVGKVQLPVEITEDIMPGVVSVPHGFGHDREGVQLGVARAHAGVSVNDLSDASVIDPLSGSAVFNGVPVELSPADVSSGASDQDPAAPTSPGL